MLRIIFVPALALALVACGDAAFSSPQAADAPLSVDGDWRFCDLALDPKDGYYLAYGGTVLRLTTDTDAGVVSGYYVSSDGGEGTMLLSGPLDPSSRVWTSDLYSDHWALDGGPVMPKYDAAVRLTFSADGDHFTGMGLEDGAENPWEGAREDGSFTCPTQQAPSAGPPPECESASDCGSCARCDNGTCLYCPVGSLGVCTC